MRLERERERKKERENRLKTITKRHIALGSGLVPNCPGLRESKKPEMFEICKSREAKRNLDVSMP